MLRMGGKEMRKGPRIENPRGAAGAFFETLASEIERSAAGEKVRLVLDMEPTIDLGAKPRAAIATITGEAVSNACRHGRPSVILVQVRNGSDLRIRVFDDGQGFDPGEATPAPGEVRGLVWMTYLAETMRGRLEVESEPGHGTRVTAVVPVG